MPTLYEQYRFNVGRSPLHEGAAALPPEPAPAPPVRLIAYYLPQFHPIAENDAWWGVGFTEWTNAAKALPRYVGHRQPRMPADLGFYDLRDADVLRRQAALAKRAGIEGFCIHDYWFSGRKVLETPLRLLLDNPDIDLPFCLNWANENWTRRWDGSDQDVLLEQKYDPADAAAYIASILPALRDPRYIRIEGRPLIMLYRPTLLPDAKVWLAQWRAACVAQGVGDPYLVMPQSFDDDDPRKYGFDAAAGFPPHNGGWELPDAGTRLELLDLDFQGRASSYDALAARMLENHPTEYRLFPGVCPSWDNEARKPGRGVDFYGATPAAYGAWLAAAADQAREAPTPDERLVFINAWNEWAEGAHLEPDRHLGYAYLAETRRMVDRLSGATSLAAPTPPAETPTLMQPRLSQRNRVLNRLRRAARPFLRALSLE